MYAVQCTLSNVRCTMYAVQCTLYAEQCIKIMMFVKRTRQFSNRIKKCIFMILNWHILSIHRRLKMLMYTAYWCNYCLKPDLSQLQMYLIEGSVSKVGWSQRKSDQTFADFSPQSEARPASSSQLQCVNWKVLLGMWSKAGFQYPVLNVSNWKGFFEGFTSIPTALTANDRNRRIQVHQASDG